MTEERMSGASEGPTSVEQSDELEILMSILMLSAQKPEGVTKAEILAVLATYGQTSLYELCEDQELQEEEPAESLETSVGSPT
jgi:hypothetical protein